MQRPCGMASEGSKEVFILNGRGVWTFFSRPSQRGSSIRPCFSSSSSFELQYTVCTNARMMRPRADVITIFVDERV